MLNSPFVITEITFIKNELTAITVDSRSGIYDIACIDEKDNHFIVEMQLSEYPEFIQRMKFYALHRFNTLVKKGEYRFENLPKIYCIGILAKTIFPQIPDYHNIAILRNSKNETIDDQMSFITLELDKFKKSEFQIISDLDKLIYTMTNLHTVTDTSQFPTFWSEEWLKKAISEVDLRNMTPEQKLAYEMTLSANALAIKNENKKIASVQIETAKKLLRLGILTTTQIAESTGLREDLINQLSTETDSSL